MRGEAPQSVRTMLTPCSSHVSATPTRRAQDTYAVRLLACLVLLTSVCGVSIVSPVPHTVAAQLTAPPPINFPGPASGWPATQTPTAADFVQHGAYCATFGLLHVGGTAIVTGTEEIGAGCPELVLYLNAPQSGNFSATVGQPDENATGTTGGVTARVIGPDGYVLRRSTVVVNSTTDLQSLSVDVSGGVALVLDALGDHTVLYAVQLSQNARALRAPAGPPTGDLPAGTLPINLSAATYVCAASAATTVLTVTLVPLSHRDTATASNCGQIILHLAPHSVGTFIMRYGMDDSVAATTIDWLSVSLLDRAGHVLRQATGVAFPGGGLRSLWLDVHGGYAIVLRVSGAYTGKVVLTATGIFPHRLPVYTNPGRLIGSSVPGTAVPVDSSAFTSACIIAGSGGTSVANTAIPDGSYLYAITTCNTAQLLLDPSKGGSFHALLGIADTAPAGIQPTVTLTATAADGTIVAHSTVRATFGAAGLPVDVNLQRGAKNAAVLSFVFSGQGTVLYDMRLQAPALAYATLYPPVEPPVSIAGGVAINPHDYVLANANVAVNDTASQLLIQDAVLQGWGLIGTSNGEADLVLTGKNYLSHQFTARIGMAPDAPIGSTMDVTFTVIGRTGTAVRQVTSQVAYGAVPRTIRLSLAGGVRLQIHWGQATNATQSVVFAMTAS